MNIDIQIIKENGKPAFAVVPFNEWVEIVDHFEEMEDIAEAKAISARIASGEEETIPHEFVKKLIEKEEHPLRLWRKYRGFTLQALAELVGVTKSALSMIETGKSQPSIKRLKALADALNCDMDDLLLI